ncbi:MAG: hypothetical protein E7417_04215 [Ruminococcaceae bacterium]|nr:hypothetical protein [Oscillospiraceae bacterium]
MENLFDNLKKGMSVALNEAEKLTKVVKDKTVNIYDTTKLNLALSNTQGKVDKHYQKIGEIIYQRYLDNRDVGDDIEEYCEEIDAFCKEINELKKRIAELKDNLECPACGQSNSKSGDYCSKCGAKLTSSSNDYDDDDVIRIVDVPDDNKVVDIID